MFNLGKLLWKRRKHLRQERTDLESKKFSEPVEIFVTEVASIDTGDTRGLPLVNLEITKKRITCLKDAITLSKAVVRSVERRLHPKIGDIILPLEDDPAEIFKQVLFGIVYRGKV